jgi:hypothetical protein
MQRFLIVLGIMLTVIAAVELSDDTQEIATVNGDILPEKATASVPAPAAHQAFAQKIEPAVLAARRIAPAAVIAGIDFKADDALVTASQTLSSASLDVSRPEIDSTLILYTPYEMTTAVQTELKRLACYNAAIDGQWGRKSREAVRQFNERSDAAYHLNESIELLTALKHAPSGLCDDACRISGSCEIVASVDAPNGNADKPEVAAGNAEPEEEAASYLPPWMRGEKLAETTDSADTEVSESYSATQTSVSRKIRIRRPSPPPRAVYRAPKPKKNWLPKGWPGT